MRHLCTCTFKMSSYCKNYAVETTVDLETFDTKFWSDKFLAAHLPMKLKWHEFSIFEYFNFAIFITANQLMKLLNSQKLNHSLPAGLISHSTTTKLYMYWYCSEKKPQPCFNELSVSFLHEVKLQKQITENYGTWKHHHNLTSHQQSQYCQPYTIICIYAHNCTKIRISIRCREENRNCTELLGNNNLILLA